MNTSGARAVLRIASRNISRDRWRSLLVGLLIMLPVAGMVGGITWWRTTTPSLETEATWRVGAADLFVYTEPPSARASTDDLRAALPTGTVVEPIAYGDDVLVLPGRRVEVGLRATNLDGLGRGTLELIDGRLPVAFNEVAISPNAASVAGKSVGDLVELESVGEVAIVGLVVDPSRVSNRLVLLHHELADRPLAQLHRDWLVALPDGGFEGDLEPPFVADPRIPFVITGNATLAMLVFGGLALTQTALVGAAAFSVSIRRRQRELGIMASAGASRRQLSATVVGEGLVLAGLAAMVGLVVGVGVVALASPWMEALTDRLNPPLAVDLVPIGLACAIGLLAGVAAAAVPAWTAARVPVVMSLSGRRPPTSSARRALLVGMSLIGISLALSAAGSAMLLADRTDGGAPFLLFGGAILGVLGFGAGSPWLVGRLERIGSRLPLAGRIALRDAARARSRTSPVLIAVLAGLAAAIAISAMAASSAESFSRGWQPSMRADQLLVSARPSELPRLASQVAQQLDAVASAPIPGTLMSTDGSERYLNAVVTEGGDAASLDPQDGCADCRWFDVNVATPELLVALGVPAELRAVAPNSVLLLVDEPFEAHAATLVITDQFADTTGDAHTQTIAARAAVVGAAATREFRRFPNAYIAPETAARLGFEPMESANGFVVRLDRPVTEADVALAATLMGDAGHVESSFPPANPNGPAGLIATLVGILLALTITAIAVALGESEGRADQRTLLAVGADPRLRRWIVAARAGVIALLAAVLAVPAGLLPAWGLYAGNDQPFVVPVLEIVAIVAVLPLVAIAGALLLSRPIPQWSAFRDVGPSG